MAHARRAAQRAAALALLISLLGQAAAGRNLLMMGDMAGMNMDVLGVDDASTAASSSASNGMAALQGSSSMDDPCYSDPMADSCVEFERPDEEWTDDLSQLCQAMPFMVGCTLWQQCKDGSASGEYCALSSLAANVCLDMPRMRGCEAYNVLCANATVVAQCQQPGPIPDVVTTFEVKDGVDSICYTHCMDGCPDCPPGLDFKTCTPLPIFARMCYEMPGMPECPASGFNAMCGDAAVRATFPLICVEPPSPASKCP